MDLFKRFAEASGLTLNMSKCVLIPLVVSDSPETDIEELRQKLKTEVPEMGKEIEISHVAKYLGFEVGPKAGDKSWKAPQAKYWSRVVALGNEAQ